jgi:lipid-binding SYLF domain-containing protein
MNVPDRAIPQAVLDEAECVAVFPDVLKAAFGIGGRGGRGVVSCETSRGWSAPAYFNLGGGSFGFQIGVESTDLVMLFMTSDGINSLLSTKLELGADASVAAGPVGREAGAATDLKLNAQILSYSRSTGLFAGVALKGSVIEPANGDMKDAYGPGVTAKEVLKGSEITVPAGGILAFPKTLASYSARNES